MRAACITWIASFSLFFTCAGVAAPFLPANDAQVLEHLAFKRGDSASAELRQLRVALAAEPANVEAATRLAKALYSMQEAEGDPRFIGYAQAVLRPWWAMPRPPIEVLEMRIALRQYNHDFEGALEDVSQMIAREPKDGRGWSWRLVINTVLANYDQARADCDPIGEFSGDLAGAACLAQIESLTGNSRLGYQRLSRALERRATTSPMHKLVVWTMLGEMAQRMDETRLADRHFRQAIALGIVDVDLRMRYADFLLDGGRHAEVVALLRHASGSDTLLLRLAIAETAMRSSAGAKHVEVLRSRFEAARKRGDITHLRAEARFALTLGNDPFRALALAQENWTQQREPDDARVLLESALAARQPQAARPALDWVKRTGHEDPIIRRLAKQIAGQK